MPKTVENFVTLAERKSGEGFLGSKFHRIVPGFMIQGKLSFMILLQKISKCFLTILSSTCSSVANSLNNDFENKKLQAEILHRR